MRHGDSGENQEIPWPPFEEEVSIKVVDSMERSEPDDDEEVGRGPWPDVPVRPQMAPERADWMDMLLGKSMARKGYGSKIPYGADVVCPRAVISRKVDGTKVVCLDLAMALESWFGGIASAMGKLESLRDDENPPIVILPVSSIATLETNPDQLLITIEFIAKVSDITPRILLLGTPADAQKLKRRGVPLDVSYFSEPPVPSSLHDVVAEPCIGREDVIGRIVEILVVHRKNVILFAPPGSGKTCTSRAVMDRLGKMGIRVYECRPDELMAGTELRGSSEGRAGEYIELAETSTVLIVVYVDEPMRLFQRTGHIHELAQDSVFDQFKGIMGARDSNMVFLMSVTSAERARLEADPAVLRRFVTVELPELTEKEVIEIVSDAALRMGLTLSAARQAVCVARHILPGESPPARELKLLSLHSGKQRGGVIATVRKQYGELAAPRLDVLLAGLDRLEAEIFDRPRILATLRRGVEEGMTGLVMDGGGEVRPFLACLVAGPAGSGKRFLARAASRALGVRRIRELPPGAEGLADFAQTHKDLPGGSLIIEGTGDFGDGERGQSGTGAPRSQGCTVGAVLEKLFRLNRWLLFLVANTDGPAAGEPLVQPGRVPMVYLPVSPVLLDPSRGLALARVLMRGIRRRVLDLGMVRRVPALDVLGLDGFLAHGRSPHDIEQFLVRRVLGNDWSAGTDGAGVSQGSIFSFSMGGGADTEVN